MIRAFFISVKLKNYKHFKIPQGPNKRLQLLDWTKKNKIVTNSQAPPLKNPADATRVGHQE